jgi:acetate---CoA ligase (ADP-forming)
MRSDVPQGGCRSLTPLLAPRSVAVVGASSRAETAGGAALRALVKGGGADVRPVNPRYDELAGIPCVATLSEAGKVELAVLAVSNERLEGALLDCAEAGVAAAAILASAIGPSPSGEPLPERLRAIAAEAGISLCGGNGLGFINFEAGVWASPAFEGDPPAPGHVTLLSHSGSAFAALVNNERGLAFNFAVSSGQELNTTVVDYMRYALGLPSTRVIGLFLETVRDPEGLLEALAEARRLRIPVVALKVGRSNASRRLVEAHSGGLAGDEGAFEAVCETYGVTRVRSLDAFADAVSLFAGGRGAGPGAFASVHDSGGERALLADLAEDVGLPFAPLAEETVKTIRAVLDPGLEVGNPLDFWDTGRDADHTLEVSLRALAEDPGVGALSLCVDVTPDTEYGPIATDLWQRTSKPFAMLANLAAGLDSRQLAGFGEIPVLRGTETGAEAFAHLFAHRDHLLLPEPPPGPDTTVCSDRARAWGRRLDAAEPLDEVESLRLLADFGVPVVAHEVVSGVEAAVAAAERLGWPVALKTAAPGLSHKSDVGGVKLRIADADSLRTAYTELAERLGARVLVSRMSAPGVELMIGLNRDERFGHVVLVAAGGVLVELLGERRLALAPVDAPRARRLLESEKLDKLLAGQRGAAAADREAIVDAVVAVSRIAAELDEHLLALDVNPLIAGPDGSLAVDALAVGRGARR